MNWTIVADRDCAARKHSIVDPAFTVVRVLSCTSPKIVDPKHGRRACQVERCPQGQRKPGARFWERKA